MQSAASVMPLVSVIMPAYNVAPYLEMAVASVMRQTYPSVELIVVDDGSTDETHSMAQRLQQRWPERIRLLHHENRGLAETRNTAMQTARGKYFALLDSDDAWDPEFLASQISVLEGGQDVDIVTGNARFFGGARHGLPCRPNPDGRPEPTLHTILTDEEAVFIMSVFRREVFERIGGFSPEFRTNEDFDYWLRAAHAGFRFRRNSTPLGWYRVREESLSADTVRMLRGALLVLDAFEPRIAGQPEYVESLRFQRRRFLARLESETVRRGLEPPKALSHREFMHAIRTLDSTREAIVAWLARYAPGFFSRLDGVWTRLMRPFRRPRTVTVRTQAIASPSSRVDRAGKDYWENVWNHLSFPPDINPHDTKIWAHRDQQFHRFFQDRLAGVTPGFSLLELGCARSAWLPYFAREFPCRIAGLDYSALGAQQSAERLAGCGIPADVRCADLFDPPADWVGAFDVVVWFGVAEHFEDTERAIRAAAAYLKPGGTLITEIPNLAGLNGTIQRWINRPIYDIHVPLDASDLGRHHRAAGLEVLRSEYLVPTDFGILNLENHPAGLAYALKDKALYVLRLLSGCIWWVDRRFGPLRPGRLTSGFVVTAARRPQIGAPAHAGSVTGHVSSPTGPIRESYNPSA